MCAKKKIPTSATHTDLGFWARLSREDHPESPRLVTVLIAAFALPLSLVALVVVCCMRIAKTGDLGSGACWALGSALVCQAVLAGFSGQIKHLASILPSFMGKSNDSEPSTEPGTEDEECKP